MLIISETLALAICDEYGARFTAGSVLRIYEGATPANPQVPITTEVLLIEVPFDDPAFDPSVIVTLPKKAAQAALAGTPLQSPVIAAGTASFFRLVNGTGDEIIQGDVTDQTGNGQVKMASVNVTTGVDATVISGFARVPTGEL